MRIFQKLVRQSSPSPPVVSPSSFSKFNPLFSSISERVIIGLPVKFIPHASGIDFRQIIAIIVTASTFDQDSTLLESIFKQIPGQVLTQIDHNAYILKFSATWKVLEAVSTLDLIARELTTRNRVVEKRFGYPGHYFPNYPYEFYPLDKEDNYDVVSSFTSEFLRNFPSFKPEALSNPIASFILCNGDNTPC